MNEIDEIRRRMAQIRHEIADMRILLDNDTRFVSQF